MKNKKKISLVLAISLIMSLLCVVPASAATYPFQYYKPGTVWDFETGYVEGDPKVLLETGTPTGNALKLLTGAQINIYFGPNSNQQRDWALGDGDYLMSVDIMMSKVHANSLFRTYVATRKTRNPDTWSAQEVLWSASGAQFSVGYGGGATGAPGYEKNQWVHLDFLFHFGEEIRIEKDKEGNEKKVRVRPTVDVYQDGKYTGTVDLTVPVENQRIDGMCGIIWQMNDSSKTEPSGYVLLDNFQVRAFDENISSNLEMTDKNELKMTVSETFADLKKEHITLTRQPLTGGLEEKIDFEILEAKGDTITIKPDVLDSGYKYTVDVSKLSTFDKVIPQASVDFYKTTDVNYFWDFESGESFKGTKNEHAFVLEEKRGKVLDINGTDTLSFKMDEKLESGRYIVSYDVKLDEGDKKIGYIRPAVDKAFGNYVIFDPANGFQAIDNVQTQSFIGGAKKELEAGVWYRMDNVFDLNKKTSNIYINGEFFGETRLWDKMASKNTPMTGFNGINVQWIEGAASLDNIRIKDLDGKYNASATLENDKLYVDFEETTLGLKASNFSVAVSDSMYEKGSKVGFDLIYQDGARATLQLKEQPTEGKYYHIELNGVTSFLNSKIEDNTILAVAQGAEQSYIKEIKLIDAYGNKTDVDKASSATKAIEVSIPKGAKDDVANGAIVVDAAGTPVSGNLSYDSAKRTMTLTLNTLIGANASCNVSVSGILDENGVAYPAATASFDTPEEILDFADLKLTKSSGSAKVSFNCVNTKENFEGYVVVSGYKDGFLTYADVKPVELSKNSAEIKTEVTFTNEKIAECDTLSTYIWNGWTNISPIMQNVAQ